MLRKKNVQYIVFFVTFMAIFIPLVLLPVFNEKTQVFEITNPNPEEWIVAARKIDKPIEEMNMNELQITSAAMQYEISYQIMCKIYNNFKDLKEIGWTFIALFAAVVLNQVIFARNRSK